MQEEDFTDEIIEKARTTSGCPFCGGFVYPEDETDETHTDVSCVNCGRSWTEVYDEDGNLLDMEPTNA